MIRVSLRFDKLRTTRKLQRYSQAALAKAAGVSAMQISRVEQGDAVPSVMWLARLACALDCRPEDLYEYTCHKGE